MNKRLWTTVLTAAGLAWGGVMAQGAELALWNAANAKPDAASFAADATAEGVSAAPLTRGGGLKTGTAGGTFAASGYSTSSKSYDAAVKEGDYWETSLTPNGGLLSLETLTYSFGGSKTGPSSWQWAAKVGNGNWEPLGTPVTWERTGTQYQTFSVDLGGLPLTDQTVGFRLVGWGASGDSGTGSFGKTNDVLVFEGTVESAGGPPVVRFSPSGGSVDAGGTLEMAVTALPGGSGVSSWSIAPTPAGTAELKGGTFSFSPAESDALQRYTVSVTATNAHGSTTGTASVFVNESAPEGTLTLTFDNERQTSWSGAGSVTIPAGSGLAWAMKNCMIGEDAESEGGDQVYGGAGRALRFAYDESGSFESKSKIVSLSKADDETQTNGVAKISFWYGIYRGDAGEESEHAVRPAIVTELSDDGKLWVEVGRVATEGSEEKMAEAEYEVGVETPVYLRIRTEGMSGTSRVNVDQLRVVPKTTLKNQLNLFLLKYNVTPGDALTTAGDDWDGDGKTNLQERRANPETNPYDRNSK